jgi:hypothetical protein
MDLTDTSMLNRFVHEKLKISINDFMLKAKELEKSPD